MRWIKEVVVDILITVVIIAAVIFNEYWLEQVLVIYTALILILRIVESSGSFTGMQQKKRKPMAPQWFLHTLYAINVVILFSFSWWFTAGQWLLIWGLSWYNYRNNQKSVRPLRIKKK